MSIHFPPNIKEIECQSALNRLKRKFPYAWDLNIYRGCQHKCIYCYAIYSQEYLEDKDFFNTIHVKTNIVEKLEKELAKKSWKREVVNIGGVTDSYQPAEGIYQLMPSILKLLIKYKTPAIISTKSNLILRDFELIDKLSRITYINIASTITTMNENVRQRIEPCSSSSLQRFEFLNQFRKTNASVGLHVMPIIPYITDSAENMESLCKQAKEAGVSYMLPGTLYLRGKTRRMFLNSIKEDFPEQYPKIQELYKTGGAGKEYKEKFYKMLNELRGKYGISSSYSKPMKEKMKF